MTREDIMTLDMDEIDARREELRGLIEQDGADLDAIEAEVEAINERRAQLIAEREERKADITAVAEGIGEPIEKPEKENRTMDLMEIRKSQEYTEAYANYVKTGNDKEVRALLSDNVQNGVIPVPVFVGEIIAERLKESKILSRIRRMTAAGNVKIGFEYGAPAAEQHTEGGNAIDPEALLLGIVTLVPKTWKKYVQISDEALDSMNGEAYLRYLYEEITRGIIKARENAVVAAILAAPQTATATAPAVAKTGSASGAIDDIVKAEALLSSAAENLVVIVNPTDYAAYKSLQMSASYGVDPFDGLEVIKCDAATAPIVGDLSGVLENCPKGDAVEFKYDDHTLMTSDLVNVLGRMPSAIGVVGNLYFAKVSA